jgi:hypothetical protein
MIRCPHCQREVTAGTPACPNCRAEIVDPAATKFATISRLSNAAEAGYFADLLGNQGIESRLHHEDHFSAVDGTWSSRIFLQVPESDSVAAATILREQLSDSEPGYRGDCPSDMTAAELTGRPGVNWVPVALVLVAGGVAYWMGQGMPRAGQPADHPELPLLVEVLGAIDAPLETRPVRGQPGYRLHVDSNNVVFIDEDLNGDGIYETRAKFRHGRALGAAVPIAQ